MRALLAFSIGHDPIHNFLLKRACCRFAQVIGITSDPKITFPYLPKICASRLELCAAPAGSKSATDHSLEGPIDLVARRSIRPHQRPRPDQTLVEPAAPSSSHLSRFRPLALFVRLPSVRVDRVVTQAAEIL